MRVVLALGEVGLVCLVGMVVVTVWGTGEMPMVGAACALAASFLAGLARSRG